MGDGLSDEYFNQLLQDPVFRLFWAVHSWREEPFYWGA